MQYSEYNERLLKKAETSFNLYIDRSFTKIQDVSTVKKLDTEKHLRTVPAKNWKTISKGESWGGKWMNLWLKFKVSVTETTEDLPLFFAPDMTYREGLVFINGKPRGILNNDKREHYYFLITEGAPAGTEFDIAVEFYAGHPCFGKNPFDNYGKTEDPGDYRQIYNGIGIYVLNKKLWNLSIDCRCLCQMARYYDDSNDLKRRAQEAIEFVYKILPIHPQFVSDEEINGILDECLAEVRRFKQEVRRSSFSVSRATVGLIGHSHMDTAWLWPVDETIRKCARTYSNALRLMDVYPEYRFLQSSTLHSEWMKLYYPSIFEDMKKRVAEGRYEPNGGVFVECDCNIPSGETMIRQFLKGQMFTRENFNYTADTFWLPDTFGYSAAIPQIMKGCEIKYFSTQKITWNDLNAPVIDTFKWRGIDGTEVLTHYGNINNRPNPRCLHSIEEDDILGKKICKKKFMAYGYGDGGGGPIPEMIEEARFIEDIDGMPNIYNSTLSSFMKEIEHDAARYPTYSGELYLEKHRGTLTQMHDIKRNNRKAEFALRETEYFNVVSGMKKDPDSDRKLKILLTNQFHDILPGSSINEVNDRSVSEMKELISEYGNLTGKYIKKLVKASDHKITVFNTLSFVRNDDIYLENIRGGVKGLKNQKFTDLNGKRITVVGGASVPAFAAKTFTLADGYGKGKSPFSYDGSNLETPYALISFDSNGAISSYVNKKTGRQLRKNDGEPLNTFWLAEDVSEAYDNWDIDADTFMKLKPEMRLVSREVVSDGSVQFRLRSEYMIGKNSFLKQDMIFHSYSEQIDFHTIINWDEKHALLKVGFDVDILSSSMKNEIQYGYVERPTTKNNSFDSAKFEVCNHKWTDISESRFGVSILNDCKYGISAEDGNLRLSLHRGGRHPDSRNDRGVHELVYSFLPHEGAMSSENVIQPSYALNVPYVVAAGEAKNERSFIEISAPNIICEAVKLPEYAENSFVIRLYECERNRTRTKVKFLRKIKKAYFGNMLEDIIGELTVSDNSVELEFHPFEIKTLILEV